MKARNGVSTFFDEPKMALTSGDPHLTNSHFLPSRLQAGQLLLDNDVAVSCVTAQPWSLHHGVELPLCSIFSVWRCDHVGDEVGSPAFRRVHRFPDANLKMSKSRRSP